jgi:hypothetical protein
MRVGEASSGGMAERDANAAESRPEATFHAVSEPFGMG